MEKIASFALNHNALKPGFYLSRHDKNVYTYDLRFKTPNGGDYISISAMHTIEHLMAGVLRNSELKDKVVYFGPMGCRTGFYLLLFDTETERARQLVVQSAEKCLLLEEIPGNKKVECGNFRSHNLSAAKAELIEYLKRVNTR